jgi:phospholipase C
MLARPFSLSLDAWVVCFRSALVLVAAFAVVDATVYKTAKDYPQQKIEHLVVLMLENRSFDHMLGTQRVVCYGGRVVLWHYCRACGRVLLLC